MPFPGVSFDFIFCRAAFKNFSRPVPALQEMERVLRPGGQALIIDLRKDTSMGEIRRAIDRWGGSPLNRAVNQFIFRFLRRRAYTRRQFE